jgi:adenine-specific DNA-methyltransferase
MTMKKLTANDPETQSPDLIQENIERLKALFPELITEGPNGAAVNVDVLKQLVGDNTVTDADEKYGLNWHGKRRARQLALTPSTGTLRPCPEESVNWKTTKNLMIEGDNLEVLKLLQKSYAGKVKLIYIDPPYNTGKDFVYPDDFKDNIQNYLELTGQVEGGRKISSNTEASGRFHTDWLNMMYPRLRVARSLLAKSGLMFISIDQNELHNLMALCNEVFGEDNFFAVLTRRAMHTVRNSSKDFNLHADYVLVYGRDKSWFAEDKSRYIRHITDKTANYPFDDGDGRGPYKLDPLYARNYYTPYKYRFVNGIEWQAPEGSYPRYSRENLARMEKKNRIVFGNGEPKAKRYLNEVQEGQPPNTILSPEDVGFNLDGTKDLSSLLESDKVFTQPKPVKLITYLLELVRDPEAITLDFFAGSGTTAHAVMAQNAADGGNRRYILVQLPEPLDPENKGQKVAADFCDKLGKPRNIAELTKERLRRAGAKVKADNPNWQGDVGFRVFKLDTSNIRAWNPNPENLEAELFAHQDHIVEGRTEADILYELLLKLGLDLCVPIETRTIAGKEVHAVGGGVLMACLAEKITRDAVEALAHGIVAWHKELAPAGDTTCVFRDSAFADDVAKTNLAAILDQHGIANVRSL